MTGFKSCFLVLKTWRFTLCLLLCFSCLPLAASAADYYWASSEPDPNRFDSAASACDYWYGRSAPSNGLYQKFESTMDKVSDTEVLCKFTYEMKPENVPRYGYSRSSINVRVFRFGNSCPAGTKWNSNTLRCESEDPCSSKNGTNKAFSKSGTAPDGYMKLVSVAGKQTAIQSTEGCFDGCLASTTDQKCTTKTTGAYFCRGTAWFTGQTCDTVGSTPGVDSSTTSEYPGTEQTSETKPCTYVTNPDGTQSCNSQKTQEQEGQVCGIVSATGQKICVDRPPNKNGLNIDSTVKTETDSGGGKTTTKTDTATTTKCTDIKTCTSTTTTVTTVTKPNGAVSGSCKGANCPDKNTNPDGNGDGFGDCVTGACEEEEGSDVSGEACDASLMCSGDAIQCAILRKEKEQKCADEKFREIKEDELKGELNEFFAKPEYQPLKPEGDNVFDMGTMFDTSRTISGSCPAINDWSVEYGMTVNIPISQVNEKLCPYYVYMGYLMVMFAMWRATEIVARGLN